ncbi:MAG: hypothetical protein FWG24_06400 [Eggerthellaceae bacterium]|nr:hypothetical protein [Eggerthellaceae bacterium]
MSNNFARLGTYLWFLCRRERIISPIWIACIAGLSALFAGLYPSIAANDAEIYQLALTMTTPSMVAMMGPVYGMEDLSHASLMAQECLVWFLVAAAIMNIFLVNRHTRVDEELGRLEMFRAMPVGRLTGSLATIKLAFGVNLLVAAITTLAFIVLDIGGTTAAGAFAYGFSIGAVGFLFAALTLLAAQIFSTSRAVSAFGFVLLGVFYIMRAMGDVAENALSYISPLGLGLKVEAFYSNDVMPLIVLLVEGVVFVAIALAIAAVRDHGSGVIPARAGKAHASRFLKSPLGLAWRLSKGTSLGWAAGLFLLGVSYGSVCAEVDSFVEGSEMMQQFIGASATQSLLDGYVAVIFMIMSMLVSVPIVMTVLRIHSEEKRGRLEQVLSKAVPRVRLYGAFIFIALIESVVLELMLALGLWVTAGGQLALDVVVCASLCYLPAIWAIAGIAAVLVGFLPRLTALVWAVFGYAFVAMYFSKMMELPDWMLKATLFGNIPQLPVEDFTLVPLVVLTLVAVAFFALGLARFRTRDILTN